MTIVIGCDSFLSLRNVRNGDLGRRLSDQRVVVMVAPDQYDGSLQAAPEQVEIECLLDFDPQRDRILSRLMDRAYTARKSYYDPRTMWEKFKWSSYHNFADQPLRLRASLLKARARFTYYRLMGKLGYAQRWRSEFTTALQSHPVVGQYVERLSKLNATVVVAFSLEGFREMALMEAARKLNLKTVVMIRSRDNLAAKIQHLPDVDAYMLWADVTRDFLLKLYPEIPAERIHITGTPQFDHHLDPAYRLSRDAFFAEIKLDPERPLIVYTYLTPNLALHEINIAQHLADAVRDGKFARNVQLLVRGHPRSFGSDHPLLREIPPGVSVYPPTTRIPYHSPEHEAQVVRLILEDEPMHLAALAYQDVQVNISGTMIVDSAILDKPIVAVHYDIPANTLEGLSAKRFYKRSDMQPILNSGGIMLANSPDECIALINRYLENPIHERDGRQRIREQEAGPVDGKAGERIAAILREFARG